VTKELRGIKPKKAITAFERAGFKVLRQKGSHVLLFREGSPLLIIPVHSDALKVGLLMKEIKKAGMTVDEFKELL
jgi:predicted RNA binding protein YcfA (HicA-like mRNA interferase family)